MADNLKHEVVEALSRSNIREVPGEEFLNSPVEFFLRRSRSEAMSGI